MSLDIITYTQNKIKELESIKENTKFFQENEDLLTLPLNELFSKLNIHPQVIPVDFILSFHNSNPGRMLYVFDCLGIKDTNKVYPDDMSIEVYLSFVDEVNKALETVGLSVDMKMTDEQRSYFDKLVLRREDDPSNHEKLDYDSWNRLIRNIIFSSVSDLARSFLQKKHAEILSQITEFVMNKCIGRRQSVVLIRKYIDEYLANNNINYSDLKKFDYKEIELDRRVYERR